jgi:hypothetical protein
VPAASVPAVRLKISYSGLRHHVFFVPCMFHAYYRVTWRHISDHLMSHKKYKLNIFFGENPKPIGHKIYVYIDTYIHAYVRTYVRTYVHIYIHTYVHTYIHTYVHTFILKIGWCIFTSTNCYTSTCTD